MSVFFAVESKETLLNKVNYRLQFDYDNCFLLTHAPTKWKTYFPSFEHCVALHWHLVMRCIWWLTWNPPGQRSSTFSVSNSTPVQHEHDLSVSTVEKVSISELIDPQAPSQTVTVIGWTVEQSSTSKTDCFSTTSQVGARQTYSGQQSVSIIRSTAPSFERARHNW